MGSGTPFSAILGNEQSGDLALHPRGHEDRPGLGERLHARGDIGRVAKHLARGIHHNSAGLDADAGDEFGTA